jgi:hypothetical protein
MRTNPRSSRRRNALLAAASTPGLAGALIVADRPLLYLMVVVAAVALLLICYVITSPKDHPFRRVHALLCLVLNRNNELGAPPQGGPERPAASHDRQVRHPGS